MIRTAAVLVAMLSAAPAGAQEIWIGAPEEEAYRIWEPAPAPEGAVSWTVLSGTEEIEETRDDGFLYIVPEYTEDVLALDGQTIQVNGYLLPLTTEERHDYFVLMAYDHSCPVHIGGGPSNIIEVYAEEPVAFTYDPILIEGRFELLYEDETGLFYRLSDARRVNG